MGTDTITDTTMTIAAVITTITGLIVTARNIKAVTDTRDTKTLTAHLIMDTNYF